MHINLVLFDHDFRILDHEPLFEASKSKTPLLGVYAFLDDYFKMTPYGFLRMGIPRRTFLLDSLVDLKNQLNTLNISLLVLKKQPVKLIDLISEKYQIDEIFYHDKVASEEVKYIEEIKRAYPHIKYHAYYGDTLYHPDDIELPFSRIQKQFTNFRHHIEKKADVRPLIPLPNKRDKLFIPDLDDDLESLLKLKQSEEKYLVGGESEGQKRLSYYFFESHHIKHYKFTRNKSEHLDDSSKFSPYLAHGNLSAKQIYHALKTYEQRIHKNISTYWLYFELLWRDYFHFLHRREQNRFFYKSGLKKEAHIYHHDPSLIKAWMDGMTGLPFVDAHMRELKKYGFMSNRGRQNVSSFFSKYLNQDWRIGAAWFESLLIDYDVSSNYGNWQYNAGVGVDPRENRIFNVIKQGETYDEKGTYVKKWISELSKLPKDFIHKPFILTKEEMNIYNFYLGKDYPYPIISTKIIDSYIKNE